MKQHRLFVVCTCIAASLLFASSVPAQQAVKSEASRIRVIEYNGLMSSLLSALAESYDVIVAFELDSNSPQRAVRISVHDGTIRDALDAIVKNRPEYQWRETDGVFEVLPAQRSSTFLNTRLMRFQVSGSTWTHAMNILLGLPEVEQAMSSLQLERDRNLKESQHAGEAFTLDPQNLTIRQALNEMTRKSGRRFWQYSERGSKPRTFSVTN